jgi:magnesium-protoporphyrin IX monomethyl ester (oxidative) cyclase
MMDVALVYLPYGPLERPSLAFGMFKVALEKAAISCQVLYPNFKFAEQIGTVSYADMGWVREEMIGEWTFAGAAFPDFQPNQDEYLRRVVSTYAGEDAEAQAVRETLWTIRRKAEKFIDETAREIAAMKPRIVACSSTFNQHCAVLGFTRRLKALDPSIITVVGGSNCESEMGLATIKSFPWLDYTVSGEAEGIIAKLCRQILDGDTEGELPFGVFAARHRTMAFPEDAAKVPRASMANLDASPIPDFDDYFAALEKHPGKRFIAPGLLIETSRGCWWGEIKHCTFCGLNGGGMNYRSKSPERAIAEYRHLSRRYGITRYLVVDNILDRKYFKEVLPVLRDDPEEYNLFYEIKANVTFEQLVLLKESGVHWIQPGIESLHDKSLDLMDKGTQAWINVQLLKYARQLGLHVSWNILSGFPGESDEWYAETAEWVPLIEHLQPTKEVRIIRFDRFSPHHTQAKKYGLNLRPTWPYRYIYPVDEEMLSHLVYFFEDAERGGFMTNPLRLGRGQSRTLGGPGRDLLQEKVHAWHSAFYGNFTPLLCMTEESDQTLIIDTRSVARERRVVLEGLEHRVHRAADAFSPPATILKKVNADGGPEVAADEVDAALARLAERRLVLRLGNRWMALAVRGDVPALPRRNEDGYPGGWIERRHRRRKAPVAGVVTPQKAAFHEPLPLANGGTLDEFTIAYETYGTLSPNRDNAILVCHALTSDAHAAGRHAPGDRKAGWWDDAIGPKKMLDTERYFVICTNVLGGSGGSSSPASLDPRTGRPYGMSFPLLTVSDMVDAQKRLVDRLGIPRLAAVVGGCFGGQQALEWAIRHPQAVERAVVMSATPSTSAHSIAIFSVMRRLIRQDPYWNGGQYYDGRFPQQGIANALVTAVPLWMSRETMEKRYGRRRAADTQTFDPDFAIEQYLEDVAGRAGQEIDPNSLIYLTRAVEYFDLAAEYGSLEAALGPVEARVLLVSYSSDWRYPPHEMEEMQRVLGARSRHLTVESPHGHGAFRYDVSTCAAAVSEFLHERVTAHA